MVKSTMERKIRILVILFAAALFHQSSAAQGFVISPCSIKNPSHLKALNQQSTDYNTYNLSSDSTINIPPYAYENYRTFLNNYGGQKLANSTNNTEVINLFKNLCSGRNIHYLYTDNLLIGVCPEANIVALKNRKNGIVKWKQISGAPFGIAYSTQLSELYVSGFKSRSVLIFSDALELKDSITLNGNSGRFMAVNNDQLFGGVRSSLSITKLSLSKRKLLSFQKTNNRPGPITTDNDGNVYYFQQGNKTVVSKFDQENLTLFESRQWSSSISTINFQDGQFQIGNKVGCSILNDTLKENHDFYKMNSLDSSGRYTWIINSYTNPKWALATKTQFEENGIKCFLASMNDGYMRLCAGLYQDQEKAVEEKSRFTELFDGAWLMTIHPHKF